MPPGSDDNDESFDALMRQLGVRPMQDGAPRSGKGKGKQGSRKRRPRKPAPVKKAPPRPPPPDKARPPAASAPPRKAPTRAAQEGAGDTRQLLAEIDRLRSELQSAGARADQLAALEQRVAELQAARDEARDALAQARDELQSAAQDAREASQERADLERSLARLGTEGEGAVPLLELLRQRGLLGASEAQQLLLAMAEDRALAPLLELLSTARPDALVRLLDSRLLLLGDCPACAGLQGRVQLRLPPARCELCHGEDLPRAVRHFYDGALCTGLTRLILVGGSARDHLVLRSLLDDRRVELVLVHGGLRKAPDEVQRDLDQARAVLLWEHPASQPQVLAAYEHPELPVLRVPGADLAAFLETAGDRLSAVYD